MSREGGNPPRGRKPDHRMILLGAALALAVTLALISGVIRFFAGSPGILEAEMRRFAPPERTGLPETEYAPLAAHMADYLGGRKADFQYTLLTVAGDRIHCFHEYEIIHMADCRGLIRLDGILCALSAGMAILCGGLLIARRREGLADARRGAKGALWGLSMIAAGLILWAVTNFDGLFITFHRIAFRNDYWLLDPRKDLLIRMMPQGMFIDMGWKGLGVFLAAEAGFVWILLRGGAARPRKRARG